MWPCVVVTSHGERGMRVRARNRNKKKDEGRPTCIARASPLSLSRDSSGLCGHVVTSHGERGLRVRVRNRKKNDEGRRTCVAHALPCLETHQARVAMLSCHMGEGE